MADALRCPYCEYELTGLARPTCPECGGHFVIAARPPPAVLTANRWLASGSMPCPACRHHNTGFLPRRCAYCGRPFSVRERMLGTRHANHAAGQ